jgi:hypothetical protein
VKGGEVDHVRELTSHPRSGIVNQVGRDVGHYGVGVDMSTSLDPTTARAASIDSRQSCSSRLLWGRRGVPQRFHDGGAFKVSARPYFGKRQPMPPEHLVCVIHALIEGLVLQRILTPELFPDEVFFAAFEALAHHRREPNLNATPVAGEPSAGKGPASD